MSSATIAHTVKFLENYMFRVQHFGSFRNVLMGGGIAYAIHSEKYYQLPIPLVFPSQYFGYHAFKNLYYTGKETAHDLKRLHDKL